MEYMHQILSPIIKNRDTNIEEQLTAEEAKLINAIIQQKTDLLNKQISPTFGELIRPEIINSWLRCNNYGLDPCHFIDGPVLDDYTFTELIRKENSFIQAVDPYINKLQGILSDTNYLILLNDPQGVFLRVVFGSHTVINHVNKKFHLEPAVIWTEEKTGTCSKEMCALMDAPIQLCGPEFYSHVFYDAACSSSPIHDVFDNLAGTITIVSPFSCHQNPHSLALAASSAWTIENELRLALKGELFNTAMEANGEPVIIVDNAGYIKKVNSAAYNCFQINPHNCDNLRIQDILGDQPFIESSLEHGQKVSDFDFVLADKQRAILKSAQPIKDRYGKTFGYTFKFQNIKHRQLKPTQAAKKQEKNITFDLIIGNQSSLERSINLAKKYAKLDGNILIQGESGTGKELYAQAIHHESPCDGPFFAVNCAAIPRDLIESELFGYEGGAFTGADRKGRPGKIEMANGGTLFLDEIGDMPLGLQAVLLRVLDDKMIIRVGGSQYTPIDFRLIAATNKNLLEMVGTKEFRADLYYRLAVFNIQIPPLRERGPDIIRLAKYFINSVASKQQISPPDLSDAALYYLLNYNWPGNVRELENAMLSAVSISSNGQIEPRDLPEPILRQFNDSLPDRADTDNTRYLKNPGNDLSMKELEKIAIIQALLANDNKVIEAAKKLGISKATLYRKIKEYKIENEVLGR